MASRIVDDGQHEPALTGEMPAECNDCGYWDDCDWSGEPCAYTHCDHCLGPMSHKHFGRANDRCSLITWCDKCWAKLSEGDNDAKN
jgi:hypothetical protein